MKEKLKIESTVNRLLVLKIFWAATFSCLFIYVLVCHALAYKGLQNALPEVPLDLLRRILYGASIIVLLSAHFLRKHKLSVSFNGSGQMHLKPTEAPDRSEAFSKYAVAMIIPIALSEVVGIFGLVLFLLGAGFQTLYLFIGVSAITMVLFRPRRKEIEKIAEAGMPGKAISP